MNTRSRVNRETSRSWESLLWVRQPCFLAGCPDMYLLAQVLGHSDVAVTRRYSHLLPGHLARARNVVSFAAPVGPATVAAGQRWGSAKVATSTGEAS